MSRTYEEWNKLLFEYFFNGHQKGRQVCLHIDNSVIDEKITGENKAHEDFIRSVVTHKTRGFSDNICDRAFNSYRRWRSSGQSSIPPFFGYLCFFIYAWSFDESLHSRNYYSRLNQLTKAVDKTLRDVNTAEFRRIEPLWEKLEEYTELTMNKTNSVYRCYSFGTFRYVGYPLAQALMSASDRLALIQIFNQNRITPDQKLADHTIVILMNLCGGKFLSPLCWKRYCEANGSIKKEFIAIVKTVFNDWKGEFETRSNKTKVKLFNQDKSQNITSNHTEQEAKKKAIRSERYSSKNVFELLEEHGVEQTKTKQKTEFYHLGFKAQKTHSGAIHRLDAINFLLVSDGGEISFVAHTASSLRGELHFKNNVSGRSYTPIWKGFCFFSKMEDCENWIADERYLKLNTKYLVLYNKHSTEFQDFKNTLPVPLKSIGNQCQDLPKTIEIAQLYLPGNVKITQSFSRYISDKLEQKGNDVVAPFEDNREGALENLVIQEWLDLQNGRYQNKKKEQEPKPAVLRALQKLFEYERENE